MARCGECKKDFSKHSNLRAHVKRKHPDKLDIIAPLTTNQSRSGNYTCGECNKGFVSFGNLRFHIKQKHSDQLEILAPLEQKSYKCNRCDFQFGILKDLVKHKSTNHKIVTTVKCPLCQYTGPSADILIQHYTQDHCLDISNETLEFDSPEAFQVWKSEIESETFASFVKTHGVKRSRQQTKTVYNCHRSGNVRTRGNNNRRMKKQGSNKIGGYCPAKMTVFVKNEKCVVHFCQSHVGHGQETDLGYLSLTNVQRENIAAKIAAKIPLQVILDDIRNSVGNCKFERIHLLTKKDLYNIQASFNLKGDNLNIDAGLIQEEDDSSGIVEALDTSSPVTDDVQSKVDEARIKLLEMVEEELYRANSLQELEAARRIIAPLKHTLAAIRSQEHSDISKHSLIYYGPQTSRVEILSSKGVCFRQKSKLRIKKPAAEEL